MIRYCEPGELAALLSFLPKDPFGCKIESNLHAYGLTAPFAGAWLQQNEAKGITAALSKVDGAAVLCAGENADFDEIEEFMPFAGIETLLCDEAAGRHLGGDKRFGPVMRLQKPPLSEGHGQAVMHPPIKGLYDVLCESGLFGGAPPEFARFYVDVSHRIRHGCSDSAGVYEGERLAAVAMAVAKTKTAALLGAVAARPGCRGKGYGSSAVLALLQNLQDRAVYLLREPEKNKHFYERLGFADCGAWCEKSR